MGNTKSSNDKDVDTVVGEIKAEIEILKELAVQYKFDLKFNEPNFLQDEYNIERMKNFLKFHE